MGVGTISPEDREKTDGQAKKKKGPSLRGPTKDYREFTGSYGGRSYRFYRMMMTNFKAMVSSRWSIGVVVISFLFLFFHVLTLVFGGGQEELLAQFDELEPEVFFRIEPVDGQPGRISVFLNQTYTLSYKVTNKGDDSDGLNVLILPPNPNWETDHWIEGDRVLGDGDSVIVHVNVTVPDSVAEFQAPGSTDIFRDLGYSGYIGERIVPSRPYIEEGDEISAGSDSPSANALYGFNTSRIIGVLVVPDTLMGEISEFGLETFDIRIRSIGTLLMLDPLDEEVSDELGLERGSPVPGLRIWMGDDDDEVYRKKMRAPQSKTYKVHLENTGTSHMEIELDCFFMPYYDPGWIFSVSEDDQPDISDPLISLQPGEEREIEVVIQSGDAPYKAHYAILITATDMLNGSFHVSDAYHMTVSITGSSDAPPEPGERYHSILWGGGFNYERYLWLILLSAFAGAGIIARDLQENSIILYLSRPITWYDYLTAKFTSLLSLLSIITVFPSFVLFFTGMAFSNNDISYIFNHLYILGAMLASYAAAMIVFASVCMAFSSLIKKWIFSGVGIFVFFIFTSTISDILLELFSNDYLRLLNINLVMKNLFRPLFGLQYSSSETGLEWYWLLLTLVAIVAFSWILVVMRFRKREVAR